jgi:hypothetical protein
LKEKPRDGDPPHYPDFDLQLTLQNPFCSPKIC